MKLYKYDFIYLDNGNNLIEFVSLCYKHVNEADLENILFMLTVLTSENRRNLLINTTEFVILVPA